MNSVGWDLARLEDEFMSEVVERGSPPTRSMSTVAPSPRAVAFAKQRGATGWSADLASEYASHLDDRLREGTICKGYTAASGPASRS